MSEPCIYPPRTMFLSDEVRVTAEVIETETVLRFTTPEQHFALRLPRHVAYSMALCLEEKAQYLDPHDDIWYAR